MDIPNILKRETEDTLKIGDRTFKTLSFDPLIGNYILLKLFTVTLPFGISDMIKAKMGIGTEKASEQIGAGKMISKQEFLELQRDILSHVEEVLSGGNSPVVRENGTYGIDKFTMDMSLQLLIASIMFNFKSFFIGPLFSADPGTE